MNPALINRRRLPDHVAEAITAVIDHFWMEQIKDYLARPEQEQQGHIFNEMLTIRQWLRKYVSHQQRSPR